MPGCVLRVVGEDFDPRPMLATLSFEPYSVFCKGDERFPHGTRDDKREKMGGFQCEVSSADGLIGEEVGDALEFLGRYQADLRRLSSIPEIESMTLDFGYWLRIDGERCIAQFDYLPPELLRLAGEMGIGIELSLYPILQR